MKNELCSMKCDPDCGFMVRSHDKNEIMKIGTVHAKEKHNLKVTEDMLKTKIKCS